MYDAPWVSQNVGYSYISLVACALLGKCPKADPDDGRVGGGCLTISTPTPESEYLTLRNLALEYLDLSNVSVGLNLPPKVMIAAPHVWLA